MQAKSFYTARSQISLFLFHCALFWVIFFPWIFMDVGSSFNNLSMELLIYFYYMCTPNEFNQEIRPIVQESIRKIVLFRYIVNTLLFYCIIFTIWIFMHFGTFVNKYFGFQTIFKYPFHFIFLYPIYTLNAIFAL